LRKLYPLLFFIFIFSCTEKETWVDFEYNTVKGYYYDFRTGYKQYFMGVAQGQTLNPSIHNSDGALLDSDQTKKLSDYLNGDYNDSDLIESSDCYVPHHGFVFYKKDSIVGHVSICFECNQVRAFPKGSKLDEVTKLEFLFSQLDIPVNPEDFPRDTSIFEYMAYDGIYSDVYDVSAASDMVKPYHSVVLNYLDSNQGSEGYYIWNNIVKEDSFYIDIPVVHIRGFYIQRDAERKGSGILGNLSGGDGTIKINKATKEVVSYLKWQ
jgi:hypothetical protein